MSIEGAKWTLESEELQMTDDIHSTLPPLLCSWKKVERKDQVLGTINF